MRALAFLLLSLASVDAPPSLNPTEKPTTQPFGEGVPGFKFTDDYSEGCFSNDDGVTWHATMPGKDAGACSFITGANARELARWRRTNHAAMPDVPPWAMLLGAMVLGGALTYVGGLLRRRARDMLRDTDPKNDEQARALQALADLLDSVHHVVPQASPESGIIGNAPIHRRARAALATLQGKTPLKHADDPVERRAARKADDAGP